MKSFEAETTIDAEPEAVWDVLVDLRRYPEWYSGVISTEGTVGTREKIRIWSEVAPERAFNLTVDGLEPPWKMVWSGGLPLGLFRGVREFTLDLLDGRTRAHVREDYTGPLLGLIWRTMPDLQPSFDRFVAGLKAEVERTP